MTTLNVAFSTTLVGTNGTYLKPGVWVDAVYFTPDGTTTTAHWTQLIANGELLSDNQSITLPEVYAGGKVYLLVWSGTPTTTDPLQGFITQESDINIGAAYTHDYRYDSVELTLSGSGVAAIDDVANLTSIVGFGLPMQLSNTNGSVGYDISGDTIFDRIQLIHPSSNTLIWPFVGGPLGTSPAVDRYGTSPTSASQLAISPPFPAGTTPPFTSDDWNAYVDQFTQTLDTPLLRMAGFFNGAPDANGIWHNQGFYNYSLSYDGTNFWLSPEANSQIKGYIQIQPSQLENSIYSTLGSVSIYTNKSDPTAYTIYDPNPATASATMNVGANNQWGDVLKTLFTGFSAGFWGATAPSVNSLVSTSVDLSSNWNWDPTYAFGRGGSSNTTEFDPYSEIFYAHSNSYGSNYSDYLMALYRTGGPLLSLYDSRPGQLGDVADLNLTIYGDGDTPAGYTTPVIYNYLAPAAGGYVAPLSSSAGSGLNMTLNFSAPAGTSGATTWMLDETRAMVTLNILTGITDDMPSWTPITFTASTGNGSLWRNWAVSANASGDGYNVAAGSATSAGSMVITGMPLNTSHGGGVTWYQVVVSDLAGHSSKTFNLYTTVAPEAGPPPATLITASASTISGGVFTAGGTITYSNGYSGGFNAGMPLAGAGIPPGSVAINNGVPSATTGTFPVDNTTLSITVPQAISGTATPNPAFGIGYGFTPQASAQQIDGGAIVSTSDPTVGYVTDPAISVIFNNGVFTTIDPSLLVMGPQPGTAVNTIPILGTPSSPVAGTLSGGVFTILPDTDTLHPTVHTSPDDIKASTTSSSVAIGWVGLSPGTPVNPTYNPNNSYNDGWITGYTNKVSPLNNVFVSVKNSTTHVVSQSALTRGDVDGQWQTPAITLMPGTYAVTMQEEDFESSAWVSNPSSPLTLTIKHASVGIAPAGTHIAAVATGALEPGVKSGVWLDLALTTSASAALPQGAQLLVYATASDGSLVGRDGQTGSGVTLADAVLAKLGPVQSDTGDALMVVLQSAFLPVTEQLHFAVLNKDGSIDAAPSVAITGAAGGTLDVSVAGVHVSVLAGNDFADSANLAHLQRSMDLPLLFLAHGDQLAVDVAGSAANTNTVGFVHMDIDPDGNLSVGGVAYGATQAFTNAVLANLDAGFNLADGGRTFDRSTSWTVAGQTGYYAPVMLSQNGDVFVVGTANSDGREHIRLLGENIFGIEDLTVSRRSDFDYNDMLIGVRLLAPSA